MNWDEYTWYFNKENAPTPEVTSTSSNSSDPWTETQSTCIGSACCYDNSTYDPTKNMCLPNNLYTDSTNTNTNANTEEIEAMSVLSKYGNINIKTTPIKSNVRPM
jgi:hypothetical protein